MGKTETQIAKENIKEVKKWNEKSFTIKSKYESQTHKASCKRFFAFLQALKRGQQKWLTYQLIILNNKITDLEQAIKLYEQQTFA